MTAGPYDDVIGTDTTPTTVTLMLPAREVAFLQSRVAGYGSGVDYLGEYDEPATDAAGIARRILRDTIGEWVVNEWRAKHPGAVDEPNEGMG